MNKLLGVKLVTVLVALGLASLLIHPFGDVKGPRSVDRLLAGADLDPGNPTDHGEILPELPLGENGMAVV